MRISACVSNNQIVIVNVVVSVDFRVLEILEISFAYMQSSLEATTKIIFRMCVSEMSTKIFEYTRMICQNIYINRFEL
jgi:hypothetical protein